MRTSSLPKKSSNTLRATWVETTRSAVEWNVPTFSDRECRRATEETPGPKGSCTWTKSNPPCSSSCSTVREALAVTERLPLRLPLPTGTACPGAMTGGAPADTRRSGSRSSAATAARDSRISARDSDGATTTTSWPRPRISVASRSTYRFTSPCCSQAYGETWAMRKRSAVTARGYGTQRGRPEAAPRTSSRPSVQAFSVTVTFALPGSFGAPAYWSMKAWVLSRATESLTWTGGDFIR